MNGLRMLVVGTDAALATAVRGVIAAEMPEAACEVLDPAQLRAKPDAAALVIDSRDALERGAETAARVRAMGFSGAIALLVARDSDHAATAASQQGFGVISVDGLAHSLIPCLADGMAAAGTLHMEQVMRARRLVAAGEMAMRLQHALNNPLAGIMAEAQLMQLEAPSTEQAAALARIVALCRRMIDLTRTLDGVGER